MKPVSLKEGIYWVGAIDWAVRDFHGYITPKGTTYNNYLVLDEEPTLVDGVKAESAEESIRNIRALVEPSRIKHIVVNHVEPDHGGALPKLVGLMPEATLWCTEKGRQGLARFHDISGWKFRIVKTGDTLRIGKKTLFFIETPMIHWPDSMMTYVKEDKVLFSQDGFGQHLASSERFDDEFAASASMAELEDAVWDYYANILMPFGTLILNLIKELGKLGVEPEIIAPDHGVIWRKEPGRVVRMYQEMAAGKAEERVVIIYDSMWGHTGMTARHILDGVKDEGLDAKLIKLRATPVSAAVKELWKARGVLIGSPTLNNNIFPYVGTLLLYLKGLKPKNRLSSAFGSYGWAGGAVRQIMEELKGMGTEVFGESFQVNYSPQADDREAAYQFGRRFALATREFHGRFQ